MLSVLIISMAINMVADFAADPTSLRSLGILPGMLRDFLQHSCVHLR